MYGGGFNSSSESFRTGFPVANIPLFVQGKTAAAKKFISPLDAINLRNSIAKTLYSDRQMQRQSNMTIDLPPVSRRITLVPKPKSTKLTSKMFMQKNLLPSSDMGDEFFSETQNIPQRQSQRVSNILERQLQRPEIENDMMALQKERSIAYSPLRSRKTKTKAKKLPEPENEQDMDDSLDDICDSDISGNSNKKGEQQLSPMQRILSKQMDKMGRLKRLESKDLDSAQTKKSNSQAIDTGEEFKSVPKRRPTFEANETIANAASCGKDVLGKSSSNSASALNGARNHIQRKAATDTGSFIAPIDKADTMSSDVNEESVAKPRLINNVQYKYKCCSGNNGRVILSALRKRTWMYAAPSTKASTTSTLTDCNDTKDDGKNSETGRKEEIVDYNILWEQYRLPKRYKTNAFKDVVLNHIQGNPCLVTKKGLYFNLRKYCTAKNIAIDDIIPLTFFLHADKKNAKVALDIAGKQDDIELFTKHNTEMESQYEDYKSKALWICKPSSLTNRGYGIVILQGLQQVLDFVNRTEPEMNEIEPEKERSLSPVKKTAGAGTSNVEEKMPEKATIAKVAAIKGYQEGWIIQGYIERPLLVAGRKFDIRCFVLLHLDKSKNSDKQLKAYYYEDEYVRTSCKKYSLTDISDRECHLTNDAVQKKSKAYGKFEAGNKLTMEEWQTSIERDYPNAPRNVVFDKIRPRMRELTALSISAGLEKLEKTTVTKSFELLGCKFMYTISYSLSLALSQFLSLRQEH